MARRLIIDTGVLVSTEQSGAGLAAVLDDDDDVVVAAVTVAELHTGIELADDRHRAARAEFLARVLELVPVEPYGLETARHHGALLADCHRHGTRRGAHDLIVAATARATDRVVVTGDRLARFDGLPGVECLVVPSHE